MVQVNNLIDNKNIKTLEQKGCFAILEHQDDMSLNPDEAVNVYFMSKMKHSKLFAIVAAALFAVTLTACPTPTSGTTPSTSSGIGTKASPNAVGDIVFSDGSASAYTETLTDEQKTAAVAVIFDASNKLGVGLETVSNKSWCSDSATANTLITCAVSESDGKTNTNEITALSDYSEANYPPFYFAANYSATGFTSGWYLPAKEELQALYDAKNTVGAAFTALGTTFPLSSGYWWSSTQDANEVGHALGLDFGDGCWNYGFMDNTYSVCAVRAF